MGFGYRHVAVNPALQELRLWQTLANFGGLDYYVMGRLDNKADQSAWERVQKVFRYAAQHEALFSGVRSVSDVLLVRESYVIPNAEERGWVRALTELHILFDETLSGGLGKLDLSKYKTIILPEKQRLAPTVTEKLSDWVNTGGALLASGQLPAMDCFGVRGGSRRNDQALGAMLRVEKAERPLFMVGRSGHFGNSFFDPAILVNQSVAIPWPHETVSCENLDEPGNVCWELENGKLTVTVPRLGVHACIVIRP